MKWKSNLDTRSHVKELKRHGFLWIHSSIDKGQTNLFIKPKPWQVKLCLFNLVHIYFRFIYRCLFDFNMQKIEVEKWMANKCGQAVDFTLFEEKSCPQQHPSSQVTLSPYTPQSELIYSILTILLFDLNLLISHPNLDGHTRDYGNILINYSNLPVQLA